MFERKVGEGAIVGFAWDGRIDLETTNVGWRMRRTVVLAL